MNQMKSIDTNSLSGYFTQQKLSYNQSPFPKAAERKAHLKTLKKLILENQKEICETISDDFAGRTPYETKFAEIVPSLEGIKHAIKHLDNWMKPKRVPMSRWLWPAQAKVMPQPLGVVGIIVPWNYPLFLAISPLTSALAAGNRVLLKMSELTPKFSVLFQHLIGNYFDSTEVLVVTGDAKVGQEFSSLPFDHLFFTGSTAVGKLVMRAASENLTPVTLELGGKSPTIIAPDYSVEKAAQSIVWGKLLNAGQTCVAPDYIFVHEEKFEHFIDACKAEAKSRYPQWKEKDYTSIINERQLSRLAGLLENARKKGAKAIPLFEGEAIFEGKFNPHLLCGVADDMSVMQEEIFGPILPVMVYRTMENVIEYINNRARPLALYVFSNSKKTQNHILLNTHSGGVTINGSMLHVAVEDLPFGGVGASGMGHCHGEAGFNTFTKQKGIFIQSKINGQKLVSSPYNQWTDKLLKLIMR